MFSKVGNTLSRWSERYVPDPFIFALGLSLVSFVLAWLFGSSVQQLGAFERTHQLASGWFSEFYDTGLMKFALQMCIILITGHAVAVAEPIQNLISKIATFARSPEAAIAIVALVACATSLIQWGLGAIVGAFMAREMGKELARRNIDVHYPLLGAAGYMGFLVWHGGFSGSAPAKVAEPGHFLEGSIGVIPISETILSPLNLLLVVILLVLIPFVLAQLSPDRAENVRPFTGESTGEEKTSSVEAESARDGRADLIVFLEDSRFLNGAAGLLMVGVLIDYFGAHGLGGWNLDSVNLIFLTLGILIHRTPLTYLEAIKDGTRGAAGIILQFPFYFGILGILKTSGLIEQIAQFFVQISSAHTYPVFTFLSAGIVNFFVPSGGGQWAVQGPIMVEAIQKLGVPAPKVIMAFSYGDAWTNMMQPFWALPLLGIMGLRARDIIGYTAFVMLVTGPIMMLTLYMV